MPVAAGGFADEQRQHGPNAFAGVELGWFEIRIDPAEVIVQHAVKRDQRWIAGRRDDTAHFGFDGGQQLGKVILAIRGWRLEIGRRNG